MHNPQLFCKTPVVIVLVKGKWTLHSNFLVTPPPNTEGILQTAAKENRGASEQINHEPKNLKLQTKKNKQKNTRAINAKTRQKPAKLFFSRSKNAHYLCRNWLNLEAKMTRRCLREA